MDSHVEGLLNEEAREALEKFHELRTKDLDIDWKYFPDIFHANAGYPDVMTENDYKGLMKKLDKLK